MHARTQGAGAALPGSFLTRNVYAGADGDATLLNGAKAEQRQGEREAMARMNMPVDVHFDKIVLGHFHEAINHQHWIKLGGSCAKLCLCLG